MKEADVAAVVLAAGASTRMGAAKAELLWRGRRWVDHVVDIARTCGCEPIVLVHGSHPFQVPGVRLIENPQWQHGQLSSLQHGLIAIRDAPPIPTGILVLTVDRPHLREETLGSLVKAHRAEPTTIWQPGAGGRRGHPILYPWDVAMRLLELPSTGSPRDLLTSTEIASRRRTVELDDPAIFANLDTPDDLRDLPD